jgi:hypothetical protein
MDWAKALQPLVNTMTGLLAAITLFLLSQVYYDVDALKKEQAQHSAQMESHLEDSLFWRGQIIQVREESRKIEKLVIEHMAASDPNIVRNLIQEVRGLAALLREKQYQSQE